ncbi:MAG: hypothetical protein VX544_03390 [Pseudomonadota bacterium]|nr:hypothetical protein [Pseudomonadota bacterium]
MGSFWDKQAEKYQRGHGIYHRQKKKLNRKTSSDSSGGMAERQIQLKIELLVETVLSSKRSVIEPARNLVPFSLSDQEKFIEAIKILCNTSVELGYNFSHYGIESLSLVEDDQWQDWLEEIIKIYEARGILDSVNFIKNVKHYVQEISGGESAVALEDVLRIIESLVIGLNGRRLKILPSDDSYTDTETLYLNNKFSLYPDKKDNYVALKLSAIHLWAQTWYGTWRIKESDFNKFKEKEKAFKTYHLLETIRLDSKIKSEYPGIGRHLENMNPHSKIENLCKEWKHAITSLSSNNATYMDSLSLVPKIMKINNSMIKIPYIGKFDPTKAFKIINKRKKDNKSDFESMMREINDEYNSKEGHDDNKRQFKIKKSEENEYDVIIELGNKQIEISKEMKKTLESIIQDYGEIPDEYLNLNYDSSHDKVSENNIEKKDYKNTEYDFIYDEWDHTRKKYKKDWCKLNVKKMDGQDSNFVSDTLSKHKGLLKHINKSFEALRQDEKKQKKLNYGDDIDIDSFVESYSDIKKGAELDEKIFTKLNKVARDVAVMFMIDMSGSTSGWINQVEKESLVLLCESLEILGDKYSIYGFSGKTRNACEVYLIKDFEEKYNLQVKDRISSIKAMDYTRMGVSIRHLSHLLDKVEAKTKLMITLSDGKPDDLDGYRGSYGIEDTRKALIETRSLGIHTYCITIDKEGMDYLPHMYGKSNFSVVNNIDKLPFKVSEIYRKITT